MSKKVSIIVPVYNVEKYLKRCVDSILGQTYDNLEVLLIDDESTDSSGKICDEYAKKDKRIKVIHKKNEGLGLTRNAGIEHSTGFYISFVDSDDFIETNTISDVVTKIEKDNSDLVMYGLNRISANGIKTEYIPNPRKKMYVGDEIKNELLLDFISDDPREKIERNYTSSSCTCLFKRSTFIDNNIRYKSERKIISEDTYMMFDLLGKINKVSIINKCYYNYCENETSLTQTYKKDRFKKLKSYRNECIKLFKNNHYSEESFLRLDRLFLDYTFGVFKTVSKNKKLSIKDKYGEYKTIIRDDEYRGIVYNIPNGAEPFKRKVFYSCVKAKMTLLCMLIIHLKY